VKDQSDEGFVRFSICRHRKPHWVFAKSLAWMRLPTYDLGRHYQCYHKTKRRLAGR